jgi:site-specific recombinase XerD
MRIKPEKETPPTSWADAVDRFLARLEQRRKSPKTIRCYREELVAFGAWSRAEFHEPPDLAMIMEGDLNAWMTWLRAQEPKLKPATINKKRAALKSFLRWSEVKGWSDPIEMPPPLKKQATPLRWLSRNDERALIRTVDRGKVLRDRALILFFLRVGVRIEEASTLRLGALELNPHKGWATIQGKGDKPRRVPIEVETVKLLNELVKTLDSPEGDPHVFQGQRGGLTPSALHRIVVGYADKAKLPGVSAHNLRHTFAKRRLDKGEDITVVSALLGHSSLNTTLLYLKPGEEDLERAVENRAGDPGDDGPISPSVRPNRRRRRPGRC